MLRGRGVRRRPGAVALLLGCLTFGTAGAEPIQSVRCAGSLIEPGEIRLRVLHKCGSPDDRTAYKRETFIHEHFLVQRGRPNRHASYRIEYLDTLSLERARATLSQAVHDHEFLIGGNFDRTGLVVAEGMRIRRELWPGNRLLDLESIWQCRREEEEIEEWTYNLGPTQFLRVFVFRNGRLQQLQFPGYGW